MGAVHRSRELTERARSFRREPTRGEAVLWAELRSGRRGVRFRRQFVIGPYIADFCCFARRLVVEVDGGIHEFQSERDRLRDAFLSDAGYRVLRLPDELVTRDPAEATERIARALVDGEHDQTKPLPLAGEVAASEQERARTPTAGEGDSTQRGEPACITRRSPSDTRRPAAP